MREEDKRKILIFSINILISILPDVNLTAQKLGDYKKWMNQKKEKDC